MRLRTPWTRSLLVGLLGALAAAGGIGVLAARTEAKGDPRVFPLDKAKKKIYGYTAAEWTVQWLQWSQSIPVSVHPLFDETGALVEVGQRGPVWFLGGVFNASGAVVRTATIPTGKALFFPILNFYTVNVVEYQPFDSMEKMREDVANLTALIDLSSLLLSVDGIEVNGMERWRVPADVEDVALPGDSVFTYFDSSIGKQVAGTGAMDGYWAMLTPLPPGEHTVHFAGSIGPPFDYTLDVTYYLTVVESNRP